MINDVKKLNRRRRFEEALNKIEEIKDFVELKPLEAAQVMRALMTTDED